MAKKLTPQQIIVQAGKSVASKSKIEDLLMDAETIKQQIAKENKRWNREWQKHSSLIKEFEVKENKAKRLIRYKRDQIISRKK